MNKTEQQAMVDRLKTTWTAFGGLTKDEQEFLEQHKTSCKWLSLGAGWVSAEHYKFMDKGTVFRLKADFQLPVERWWYCNEDHTLQDVSSIPSFVSHGGCVEVSPDDLAYVKAVIERKDLGLPEWEYRMTTPGCEYISAYGEHSFMIEGDIDKPAMRFVRKTKPEAKFDANCKVTLPTFCPEKKTVQKEFDVYQDANKILRVKGFAHNSRIAENKDRTLSKAWHYAIDRGMGMEFLFEGNPAWSEHPNMMWNGNPPMKCIKVRCFVTEDGE